MGDHVHVDVEGLDFDAGGPDSYDGTVIDVKYVECGTVVTVYDDDEHWQRTAWVESKHVTVTKLDEPPRTVDHPPLATPGEYGELADWERELLRSGVEGDTTFVTSDSGASKGRKRAAFNLIPTDALWELAEHYGKGADKYDFLPGGLDNWRGGYDWSLSYAAAFRHLTLAMGGEDVDPETGSKHVIAVAWHMLALAHWMENPDMHKYDDRQDVLEKKEQE